MKLSNLAALPLTYAEVGATAGPLPPGYHHVQKSAAIGRGRRLSFKADLPSLGMIAIGVILLFLGAG